MPLMRGSPIGYDAKKMVFQFSMMDGDRAIRCEISSAAMDLFAKNRRPPTKVGERPELFREFRSEIERVASTLWDNEHQPEVVRIFSKHCCARVPTFRSRKPGKLTPK